jgi:hypothetical protein
MELAKSAIAVLPNHISYSGNAPQALVFETTNRRQGVLCVGRFLDHGDHRRIIMYSLLFSVALLQRYHVGHFQTCETLDCDKAHACRGSGSVMAALSKCWTCCARLTLLPLAVHSTPTTAPCSHVGTSLPTFNW